VLAAKRSDRRKARMIILKCRKLAKSYPPNRDDDRTDWIETIRNLQTRVRAGHNDLPAKRLLGKEKVSLILRLQLVSCKRNPLNIFLNG
jgi:hypothetical protein